MFGLENGPWHPIHSKDAERIDFYQFSFCRRREMKLAFQWMLKTDDDKKQIKLDEDCGWDDFHLFQKFSPFFKNSRISISIIIKIMFFSKNGFFVTDFHIISLFCQKMAIFHNKKRLYTVLAIVFRKMSNILVLVC